MADVILVAASGLAREVLAVIRSAGHDRVIGFLDDDEHQWGNAYDSVVVLGGLDTVSRYPDAKLVLCAGKGSSRVAIASRLAVLGRTDADYATIVHDNVVVPPTCAVGVGSIILAGVVLTTDAWIGRHVVVMPNCTITHDDSLGDGATLASGVSLGGGVRLNERAYLGMNAAVLPGVSIGADATVGMGSAVTHDVPAGETWVGVPAAPIGARRRS
ncbi:MAG: acetyltransferase [Cryobacterium sp.]|nr:acetyltransferase [Cryobacterium sp.]